VSSEARINLTEVIKDPNQSSEEPKASFAQEGKPQRITPIFSKLMQLLLIYGCCLSKPTGEQRQATRGAGRLPRRLVGPGPSVNGPEVQHTPWLDEMLGVPPDLYLIREVKKSLSVISLHA
jgi:hypothetical protein